MTAPDLPPLPPVPPGGPIPGTSTTGGPSIAADPTGLAFDRADLGDIVATPLPPGVEGYAVTGRGTTTGDPLCGHLPGEQCDDECAYWRMVALGELPDPDGVYMAPVVVLHPFDLRQLAEQHVTAAEVDRYERGAA